jgi:hypothetical protein
MIKQRLCLLFFSWAQTSTQNDPPAATTTKKEKSEEILSRKNSRLMSLRPDAQGIEKLKEYMSKKGL